MLVRVRIGGDVDKHCPLYLLKLFCFCFCFLLCEVGELVKECYKKI